ncbi:MAG: RDD family protein [bacterium]|nr:RDD family protein [bacterium]MDO8742222.1 RDD family protein [bacterium]
MPNEQLVAHIRTQFASGVDKTTLIQQLLTAGWKVEDINAAIAVVDSAAGTNIPSIPQVPRPQYATAPTVQTVKYAGFWVRVAAWFVDALLVGLPLGIMSRVLGDTIYVSILAIIAVWGYILFMVTAYQATLGKMAVGLRIQGTDGDKIGFGRVFMREIIGKILSSLVLIGYLMVAWTGKKQGLHDKIAGTVVIEKDPNKSKTGWVVCAVLAVFALPIAFVIYVLTILNFARANAETATVVSYMSNVEIQAEIYYDGVGNGTFLDYCNSLEAMSHLGNASYYGSNNKNKASSVCNDTRDAWAASVPLNGKYYCTDSMGTRRNIAQPLASGETSCDSN